MKKQYISPMTEELSLAISHIIATSDPEAMGIQSLTEGSPYTGGWV